jgi:PIN domain nuclease of toxin-antitoxin system
VKLLLDTHILFWWMLDDQRLTHVREMLAAEDADIAVSAASFWEIEIKRGLQRAGADFERLDEMLESDRFTAHMRARPGSY